MTTAVQSTLWASQPAGSTPTQRIELSDGAWVDLTRSWMSGGFDLFDRLVASSTWRSERRRMYDNMVDVPRLLSYFGERDEVPWPELVAARTALSDYYQAESGERFATIGLCLYRDGRDSVAWHGDTIGRGATDDTAIAILSLGASRVFALRPKAGESVARESLRLTLDHGDLIVMGGNCQRTWDHAIPKTARRVGPRVSVQFRAAGVR